jgi:undecaprenyl diphosphate synthase
VAGRGGRSMAVSGQSEKLLKHVAVIMDGNGRWAEARGYPRFYGHVRGASRVKRIVLAASDQGVKVLTLFAFSTENWSRPEDEKNVLWKLLRRFLLKEKAELARNNVRLRVFGELERLGPDVREVLDPVVAELADNDGLQLNFCVSYGGRRELARAARLFAEDCTRGLRKPEELHDESVLESYLWTAPLGDLSDVDLVIRTSGEQRISNFLLWQAAYAEYFFSPVAWPDFTEFHFEEAVEAYRSRDRRFGSVGVREARASSGLGVIPVRWESSPGLERNVRVSPSPLLPRKAVFGRWDGEGALE